MEPQTTSSHTPHCIYGNHRTLNTNPCDAELFVSRICGSSAGMEALKVPRQLLPLRLTRRAAMVLKCRDERIVVGIEQTPSVLREQLQATAAVHTHTPKGARMKIDIDSLDIFQPTSEWIHSPWTSEGKRCALVNMIDIGLCKSLQNNSKHMILKSKFKSRYSTTPNDFRITNMCALREHQYDLVYGLHRP